MPTYAIHHVAAYAGAQSPRPRGARRIALRARQASAAHRRTLRLAA